MVTSGEDLWVGQHPDLSSRPFYTVILISQSVDTMPLTSLVSDLDELETWLLQGDTQVGAGL